MKLICVAFFSKVVIRRKNKHAFTVHSGDRRSVTTIELVSSRGRYFRPMIIFQGAKIQKAWTNIWSEPVYAVSQNGWTDVDHEVSWLEKVSDPQTANIGGRRFLFVDGHNSHVSAEFISSCWPKKIVPLCLPSHTTHHLQPLNVECFGPLNKTYKKALENRISVGMVQIDKLDFLLLLKSARENVLTQTVIMSAWAAAGMGIPLHNDILLIISGIYPYDPDAVLAKLLQSTSSVLTSSFSSQNPDTVFNDRESLLTFIDDLNLYSTNYKSDLRRVKQTVNFLYSDVNLSRESTRTLFKANIARNTKKNKKKEEVRSTYDGKAFGRVLTEKDAKRYKEEEERKLEQLRLEKEVRDDKRIANDTKKLVNA